MRRLPHNPKGARDEDARGTLLRLHRGASSAGICCLVALDQASVACDSGLVYNECLRLRRRTPCLKQCEMVSLSIYGVVHIRNPDISVTVCRHFLPQPGLTSSRVGVLAHISKHWAPSASLQGHILEQQPLIGKDRFSRGFLCTPVRGRSHSQALLALLLTKHSANDTSLICLFKAADSLLWRRLGPKLPSAKSLASLVPKCSSLHFGSAIRRH